MDARRRLLAGVGYRGTMRPEMTAQPAILEEVVYDGAGQLMTGTLMEYALPRAGDVPSLEVHHVVTPSPLNPLGVKGAGKGGTLPAPAAIANAVADALRPLGVAVTEMPLTPERLWRRMQAS